MSKSLLRLLGAAQRLWSRFNDFLTEQADRRVDAWGASLQYKRSYTNPDTAKRHREPL